MVANPSHPGHARERRNATLGSIARDAREPEATESSTAGTAALRGAFAGIVGGAALSLVMMVIAAAAGDDVWRVLKAPAAPFVGYRALRPGFDFPVLWLGSAVHFAISAAWGAPFALVVRQLRPGPTLLAGVAWGFVVWAGMYYVALPLVGLARLRHDTNVPQTLALHVFFSLAMTIALLFHEYADLGGLGPRLRRVVSV